MADSSDEDVAQRPAKIPKKSSSDKRLIVVLENASLETVSHITLVRCERYTNGIATANGIATKARKVLLLLHVIVAW